MRVKPVVNLVKFQTIAIQSLLWGLTSAQSRTSCKSNLCPTTFPSISIEHGKAPFTSSLFSVKRLTRCIFSWNEEFRGFADSLWSRSEPKAAPKVFLGHVVAFKRIVVSGILCNWLHITSAYCPCRVSESSSCFSIRLCLGLATNIRIFFEIFRRFWDIWEIPRYLERR